MRTGVLAIVLLSLTSGCTHLSLRDNTAQTATTLTDINYRMVLDNVALFSANPAAIPSFAVVNAGTVTVSDQKTGSLNPAYAPTLRLVDQAGGSGPIVSVLFGANGQRLVSENWSLVPVADPDNMRRLRCALQYIVLGENIPDCGRCSEELKEFFLVDDLAPLLPRGWYHVGRRKDVPREACYVGHYHDTYVWVDATGLDALSRVTMSALDLATGELQRPQKTIVKTYKGDPKTGTLESTQVTSTEVDYDALDRARRSGSKPDRERVTDDPNKGNRGLFFVPRQ